MPVALSRGERKALVWMIGAAIALAIVTIVMTPKHEQDALYPSSYSPTSHGAKAAYLLLQQMGYNVTRWERPLSELPESGKGTVLVMARTGGYARSGQREALRRYIATGGRVVCFGYGAQWILPHGGVEFDTVPETEWKAVAPALPSRLTRGGAITLDTDAHWRSEITTDLVHYKSPNGGPIVVSYTFGSGEVVWWASTIPVTNAGIMQPGNLEFVLNSIGDKDLRVFWNEYSGSEYKSLWQRAWETPVKWLFGQSALFAVFLLLTYARRSGPVRQYVTRSRLSPLEFTETLGALYKRAHASGFALEAAYSHFRSEVTRKYGVRRDAPVDLVAKSLQDRFPALDGRFETTLREIEGWMHDSSVSEDVALDLVQRLQEYAVVLKLGPGTPKEKS